MSNIIRRKIKKRKKIDCRRERRRDKKIYCSFILSRRVQVQYEQVKKNIFKFYETTVHTRMTTWYV